MSRIDQRTALFLIVATLLLGGLLTWLTSRVSRPAGVPVVLEMTADEAAPVYLRWGDGADQQILLEPEASSGSHRLEVIATGERNPESQSDEVWLLSILGQDGTPLPLSELDIDENWVLRPDGTLGAYSEKPARAVWEGETDTSYTLNFLRHPFSGQVRILWDENEQTLDLFSTEQTTEEVVLPLGVERWRGELPPESIEALDLVLSESLGTALFSELRIGRGDDIQFWTADWLAREGSRLDQVSIWPQEDQLELEVTAEEGSIGLPGLTPLGGGLGAFLALFGRFLGLTLLSALLVIGAFVGFGALARERQEAARRRILSGEPVAKAEPFAWLLDGRWGSLLVMTLAALAIMVFLFATVHQRTESEIFNNSPNRYAEAILVWLEDGYLRHGGLRFLEPVDENPSQEVWRSSTMGYLQSAHLLERVHYLFTGRYSVALMNIHNQAVVALAAALIGLLSMRLILALGVRRLHGLLLGLGALIVYQTFPINLWYFWEIYPTPMVVLFAAAFLLFEDRLRSTGPLPGWFYPARSIIVFFLIYSDPVTTGLFLGVYILFGLLVEPPMLTHSRFLPTVLLPAALAIALSGLQILWVRSAYPDVVLKGGGFLFRSGFDGSVEFVRGFSDLFYSRFREASLVFQWKLLFLSGVGAVTLLFGLYLTRIFELRRGVVNILLWLGLYIPFAFIFNQAAIIHPYQFDIYVAAPLVIALLALAPAALERISGYRGFWVFLFVMLAFAYAMVQIRTYAIEFPLS